LGSQNKQNNFFITQTILYLTVLVMIWYIFGDV